MKLSEQILANLGRAAIGRELEVVKAQDLLAAVETLEEERSGLIDGLNGETAENAELREKLATAEAELARLKSSHTEGQWAVTCEGMDEADATVVAESLVVRKSLGRTDWKAVPLHAPEDGPWVVMVGGPSRTIRVYWSGHADYYTRSTDDAAKCDNHVKASEAAKEYQRKYGTEAWPVRLSDVESRSP